MRSRFPGFSTGRMRGGVTFRGELRPRPGSPSYVVDVAVPDMGAPKVWVRSPGLAEGAPHLYDDGSLCLYHPRVRPWRADDLAASTVVPWAAIWLDCYEGWLETGVWWGPEVPHDLHRD